jgi:hypothetical protein
VVVRRSEDLVRAPAVANDPIAGEPEAARYVPRAATGGGTCRDVLRPVVQWTILTRAPGGDITQGSGERFATDSDRGRILVFVDRLGVFQAFDAR